MWSIMLFLHVIGATLLGFYFVLPFLSGRIASLSGAAQQSFVGLLRTLNRVGQFTLIAALVTGGSMIHLAGVSPAWMAASIVLLLALGALTGMMGARMKKLLAASQAGSSTSADAGKVGMFSWIAAVLLLAVIYLMTNPGVI